MRLLFWSTLYILILSITDTATDRSKRVLAFRKGSTFFYRMNYKITCFKYTSVFAQATGFKVVWKLPEGPRFKKPRSIYDFHEKAKLMYESQGFNGEACLMRNICEATEYVSRRDGVIGKILKLLLRSSTKNGTIMVNALACGHHTNQCPLQFIGFNDFSDDGADKSLSRQKRYLIFPQGSNVQLVYCLTIGAYGKDGDLVVGLTAALAWQLPNKVDKKLSKLLHRKSRSVIFPKIESFLQSTGLDGKSCVMRALCESGQRSESEIGKGTFVQELLHAIFTLPSDGTNFESIEHRVYDYAYQTKEDCRILYPTCEYSIYQDLF